MLTDHKVLNMGMTILLKVELEERLKKANQAMGMLKTVWNNNNFSVHTKIKIYKTTVGEQLETDPLFYQKIVFSDEAHFWLNGFVNKQNCRIWSQQNPQQFLQTLLNPEKCTVWCGLHAGGIIGLYFFLNEDGVRCTVNGDRYRTMINDFFFENMENIDPDEMWFQQDGATCHTANATIDLLKTKFDDKLISRNGPVNWPPRSCDLTPLDFFLWGYVKSKVYADKPATIDALVANIERVIRDIRPEMLEKVAHNWTSRIRFVKNSRGGHMSQIIFKC